VNPRQLSLLFATLLIAVVGVAVMALANPDVPPPAMATVGGPMQASPIAKGFVGLSLEFQAAAAYTEYGSNPVLSELIRNMNPGGSPVLRIGGDSTDHTWWPTPGIPQPPGVDFSLTPSWMAGVRSLAQSVGARLILGVNLEADNPSLAGSEARAFVSRLGSGSIQALEIGNEPSLYGDLAWYTTSSGRKVPGRPRSYSVSQYLTELSQVAAAMPPRLPLAGPALGAPSWMNSLPEILDAVPRIQLVTYHRYPTNRCYTHPGHSDYPTVPNLLRAAASQGLGASINQFAETARVRGRSFRVAEMNSVACSGKLGVSNTFASALWVIDALFSMARNGAAGVNLHMFPGARYRLFSLKHSKAGWRADVAPEYYGTLMFAQAAPPGARLLTVSPSGGPQPWLREWATRSTSGVTRIVLINDSLHTEHAVDLHLAHPGSGAEVEQLLAPSVYATSGVTLGGRQIPDGTSTGLLAGTPQESSAIPIGHGYEVTLPAGSAALVTIDP
jgi:hypothetical protein